MEQLLPQDAVQPVEQLLLDAVEGVLQPLQLLSCRLHMAGNVFLYLNQS